MSAYYDDSGISMAVFAGIYFFLFLIFIAGYVIAAFFLMKIFDKAGVEGRWRAWVPVYNYMVFAKLGDLSPWIVLVLAVASLVPVLNWFTGLAFTVFLALAAYRVGLKLQKEAVWVILWVLLAIVWLGINAFDKSRWNPAVRPAPWAGNFLADKTVWAGIPVQPSVGASPQAQGGYPSTQGTQPSQGGYAPPPAYPSQGGQTPPPPSGYTPPPSPAETTPPAGTTPPPPPGYTPPPAPPASTEPPRSEDDRP